LWRVLPRDRRTAADLGGGAPAREADDRRRGLSYIRLLSGTKEAPMPSFDIVSRVDMAEVDNALAGVMREIGTRFAFKGSQSSVKREEAVLTVVADDALKLKQMQELIKGHLTRRKVDAGALDFAEPEKAAGSTLRQTVKLRQGIDRELAKKLVQSIKDAKLKVQASIQGDELRVSGKKRDDLQAPIAGIPGLKLEQ